MGGRDFTEPRPSALGASRDVRWPQELLVRRAAIDAALEGLAVYEFGPGQGHGLREYWRKRHESEQAGRGAINPDTAPGDQRLWSMLKGVRYGCW
jgi:hypothetical protein